MKTTEETKYFIIGTFEAQEIGLKCSVCGEIITTPNIFFIQHKETASIQVSCDKYKCWSIF